MRSGPVRPVTSPAAAGSTRPASCPCPPPDLANWDIARINRAVLPADDWAAQETPIKLNNGTDSNYGLGVFVRDVNGRRAVTHTGEAVGFLSANNVFPKDRAAVVVLTNTWSGDAFGRIAREHRQSHPAPAGPGCNDRRPGGTRQDDLRPASEAGQLDRSQLTENANYYFTPQVRADFQSSLAPLGQPTAFEPSGEPQLRGGFVIQGYQITYPTRTLNLSTFYEPGANGRIEQFLVTPGE